MKKHKNSLIFGLFFWIIFSYSLSFAYNTPYMEIQPGHEGKDAGISSCPWHPQMGNLEGACWGSYTDINNMRMIVEFDLSSVPKNSNIQTAMLSLTESGCFDAYHIYNAHIFRITESWEESTVDWTHRTATDLWTNPGVTYDSNLLATSIFQTMGGRDTQSVNFDITDLVKSWITDEYPNYGLIVYPETLALIEGSYGGASPTNNYGSFLHSDSINPEYRPKLTLMFSRPVPLPSAFLLFTSGLLGLFSYRRFKNT